MRTILEKIWYISWGIFWPMPGAGTNSIKTYLLWGIVISWTIVAVAWMYMFVKKLKHASLFQIVPLETLGLTPMIRV
jgi:hypothetical protein